MPWPLYERSPQFLNSALKLRAEWLLLEVATGIDGLELQARRNRLCMGDQLSEGSPLSKSSSSMGATRSEKSGD
jgi:hypothetical protein